MSETPNLPASRISSPTENRYLTPQIAENVNKPRIGIRLNLSALSHLDDKIQNDLIWFHQHALDTNMSLADCARALNYEKSVVFRVLQGTYEGSYANVQDSIHSYRAILEQRGTIQQSTFVENTISRHIFAGLNYAMANNSMTLICGPSGTGKSESAKQWRERNNHGRSVFVTAPVFGGARAIIREIAIAVGVSKALNSEDMLAGIHRAFNKNRILIVDEAHRLLATRSLNPVQLEILRDIHDRTGAAVALISTARFKEDLEAGKYQFEQILRRIGMPIRLTDTIKRSDHIGIVKQYFEKPSDRLLGLCDQVANGPGRMGMLVEILKVSSRMASKAQNTKTPKMTEEYFFKAYALRNEMSGGPQSTPQK